MAHAKPEDLKDIETILAKARETLKEKSLGCFYWKSKGVLHFHTEKSGRRYAHVFDGKRWHELDIEPTPSKTKQLALVKQINGHLSKVLQPA